MSADRRRERDERCKAAQRATPSRLKRMFEGRAKYLTWTILFTVWGGAILGITLATLPAGSTGKGALPRAPGRARVLNCGCVLSEGGRLDLEVERTADTLLWFLTDGARRVPLVEPRPDSLQGPVLPSNLGNNTSMDLYLGCTGTEVVVASFEQVGAFAFPRGQHRWTRRLSRRVESGLGLAKKDGEVRCYSLEVDLGKGTVAVPVRGGWKPSFDLQNGQPR